jgi:hypothetical protein
VSVNIDDRAVQGLVSKLTVGGIPAVLFVILFVWVLKYVGLPTKLVPLATVLAGALAALLITLTDYIPEVTAPIAEFLALSVALAFAGSGAYSQWKRLRGYQTVPPGSLVTYPDKTKQVILKP